MHKEIVRCSSDEFFTGFETKLWGSVLKDSSGVSSEMKMLQGWGAFINSKQQMQRNMYVAAAEEEQEEVQEEKEVPLEVMPLQNQHWNQGRFQININYCHNCLKHKNTSIHEEADFAEKCNKLADLLKNAFPNIELQANYDSANNKIEYFDVYIRGYLYIINYTISYTY